MCEYAAGKGSPAHLQVHLRHFSKAGGPMQDSVLRSAVKGLVWRAFSTMATVTLLLVLLKDSVKVRSTTLSGSIDAWWLYH